MSFPSGSCVYVVDDDASVRRALARLLKSAGFVVESFASAEAFLSQMSPDRASCIVLDVQLPGMNGVDLQQVLKARQIHVPLVFITGHGDADLERKLRAEGACGYLQKPFEESHLISSIRAAIAAVDS